MYTVYQLIGIAEVKTIHSLLCHLLYLNMGELPLELLIQMVGSLSNSCILAQQVLFVMLCCSAASTITTVLVGVFIFGSFIEAFFSSKTRTCLAVQS
jgi:hypothetical protein